MAEILLENKINRMQPVPGIALDIGANHGRYSTIMSKKFDEVHTFEINEENYLKLVANCKEPNVTHHLKAIGVTDGKIKYWPATNPGGHTTNENVASQERWGHKHKNFTEIPSVTIDSFCKGKTVAMIKCDIEGGEDFIFNHGTETLRNNKMWVLLETHKTVDVDRLYNFFIGLGYEIYDRDLNKQNHMAQDRHYLITNRGK
jgi:FkbM family methyltransferase